MNQSRPVFISVKVIIAVLITSLMALYVLFPKLFFFETEQALDDPQLARPYLQGTLISDPDNQDAIQKLAEVDVSLGNLEDARRAISRIKSPVRKRAMTLKWLFACWQSKGHQQGDDDYIALKNLLDQPAEWNVQELLYAKSLGLQDRIASYYDHHGLPLVAARHWMMAGRPDKAFLSFSGHVSQANFEDAITAALFSENSGTALEWWLQHGDQTDIHRTLEIAQLAGDKVVTRRAAEQLLAESPENRDYQRQVLKLRIETTDLSAADSLLSEMIEQSPEDIGLRHQQWQLAMWMNQPEKAVKSLIWLMNHDAASTEMLAMGAEHARQLFLYGEQLSIYRYLTKKKLLTPKQLDDWMYAYEYYGHGQEELRDIAFYERELGADNTSQHWKARNLYESGDLAQLRQFWPKFRGQYSEELLWWFGRSFWLNHEYSQALLVYQNVPSDAGTSYWTARVNLANLAGDLKDEAYSYQQLNLVSPLQGEQLSRYLELNYSDQVRPDEKDMAFLWQHTDSDRVLERIAYFSWKSEDQTSALRVREVLEQRPLSPQLATAWVYLSYVYQQAGDYEQAKNALAQAQLNAPGSANIAKEQGWLALSSQDLQAAKVFMRNSGRYPAGPFWSQMMSSLALYTQNWQVAYQHLSWLTQHNPDELSWQVSYASVLEKVGKVDQALWLQTRLLRVIPQDQTEYQQLISRWLRAPRQFSELKPVLPAKTLATRFSGLPQSVWWLKRHAATKLEAWQQLQLSMETGDFQQVRKLVKQHSLSAQDEINSLVYLRQPYNAMKLWHQRAEELSGESGYELARTLRPYYFRAFELDFRPKTDLDSRERWMKVYFPFAQGQWKIALGEQFNGLNDGRLFSISDEITWQRWQLGFDYDHHQGELESRNGFGIHMDYQWTERLQLGVDLQWDRQSAQNALAQAFGQQSEYGVTGRYQLDSRQNINLAAHYLDISERSGGTIVEGMEYEALYQYTISRDFPSLQAYSSVIWQTLSDTGLSDISNNRPGRRTPVIDNFRRIAVGTTIGSATGITPPYTGGDMRWSLDISTGYQPDAKRADVLAAATVGWTLTGDDSLNVSLGYQTRDKQGNESARLHIGYYINF